MTFSIVARSDDGESWGVAVASKFLAVGAAVPAARAQVGAVATQALPNLSYKPRGLALLSEGRTAQEALDEMVGADDGKSERQAGIVDAAGGSATYTGADCLDWAGGLTGPGVAIQGNILTGPEVMEAMHDAWQRSAGEPDLARRLLAVLVAGDDAGGDRRGRQSAALLVVQEGAGYGFDDVAVDLRVDDHKSPVPELGRLLDIHALLHRPPPEADRIPWSDKLRQLAELDARTLGHASFDDWVGTENYEMRVSDAWVDKRVLRALWASSGGSR